MLVPKGTGIQWDAQRQSQQQHSLKYLFLEETWEHIPFKEVYIHSQNFVKISNITKTMKLKKNL